MPSYLGEENPGNLGFILSDLYMKFNEVLRQAAMGANVNLDLIVLGFEQVASYVSEDDKKYLGEWKALQAQRHDLREKTHRGENPYEPGAEGWEQTDLAFRVREAGIITRCLCRSGVLTKVYQPGKVYVPKKSQAHDLEVPA